jgi:hypothetical protein
MPGTVKQGHGKPAKALLKDSGAIENKTPITVSGGGCAVSCHRFFT